MLALLLVPAVAFVPLFRPQRQAADQSTYAAYAPEYAPAYAAPEYVYAAPEESSVLGGAPWLLLGGVLGGVATLAVKGWKSSAQPRARVSMDETLLEKALSGELEQEGADNCYMSEVGWASYLDENCQSSYNMNQRFSQADDGYVTPDLFSNPVDVIKSWLEAQTKYVTNPLEGAFPTISNDQSGNRSYPKGSTEVQARTIKPKVKDFDPKKRITGIPGFNLFGTPSSKQDL
jgi:hypothetical protein